MLLALQPVESNAQSPAAASQLSWYLRRDSVTELYVTEIGTGHPVIVLHGGPGADHSYMLPIARGLERFARFVFYDQRGSLRSRGRTPMAGVTMQNHVEDLDALRKALGVDRVNIVSHSAGTLLAFEYLKQYPQHVGNLILTGALPHKNGKAYFDAEYAALWQGLDSARTAFSSRDAATAQIAAVERDSSLSPEKRAGLLGLIRQNAAELYHIERWREQQPMRVMADAARATRESTQFEYNYGPLLAGHAQRVVVINGEYDYTVGPRGSPLWKRLVETEARNVRVIVIPRASHKVWADQPDALREALQNALRSR